MNIPVDGLVVSGNQILADESAMTGEADEIKKATYLECMKMKEEHEDPSRLTQKIKGLRKHELPSPILQSGTNVAQGEGLFICLMVGENSCLGKIIDQMEKRDEKTPLQEKLGQMAEDIGKMGMIFAYLTMQILLLRFIAFNLFQQKINMWGPVPEDKEQDVIVNELLNSKIDKAASTKSCPAMYPGN